MGCPAGSAEAAGVTAGAFASPLSLARVWEVVSGVKGVTAFDLATLLTRYMRSLPEPLGTFGLWSEWKVLGETTAPAPGALEAIMRKLPAEHLFVMHELGKMLAVMSKRAAQTKMTSSNLGVVFGPTLIMTPPPPLSSPWDSMSTAPAEAVRRDC